MLPMWFPESLCGIGERSGFGNSSKTGNLPVLSLMLVGFLAKVGRKFLFFKC